MNTKLAAILLLLIIVLFTGFKTSETLLCSNADLPTPEASKISGSKLLWTSETILKSNLKFTDFKIQSLNEREVRLSAFTDNSGTEQTTEITATFKEDSILLVATVRPNDRNVFINYRVGIKLR